MGGKKDSFKIKRYFSDFFGLHPEVVEAYGAFNVSLVSDLPLFIDPFLLFNSEREDYKLLHDGIISYLLFLRDKSLVLSADDKLIRVWYQFPEVKQNWLGFTAESNRGSGLGRKFAVALHSNLQRIFTDFGRERITQGSHLEKLCLISSGVGRDTISDFTTNLIKEFLLNFTQTFARQHLSKSYRRSVGVQKVRFNRKTEVWEPDSFELPFYNSDYVILTPLDMLTRDDTWINRSELVDGFERIPPSIPDEHLREQVNNYFLKLLPDIEEDKNYKKSKREATVETILKFPEIIDYYIRFKEDRGDEAENASSYKVAESRQLFYEQFRRLGEELARSTEFYQLDARSYRGALNRILLLKQILEIDENSKLLYFNGQPLAREEDLNVLYQLTWNAELASLAEPPDGDGLGESVVAPNASSKKRPLIVMKLARNSQLHRTVEKKARPSDAAGSLANAIVVIVCFTTEEIDRVNHMIKDLELDDSNDIVLIDVRLSKPAQEDEWNVSDAEELVLTPKAQGDAESGPKVEGGFANGYALIIGVGADLPVTVVDATALRTLFVDPRRAFYPPSQVQLLTEREATRENILSAFDRLATQTNENPDATVIVYYSGHGGRVKKRGQPDHYFLIPYGFDGRRLVETSISGIELTSKVGAITARKLIVFLDCCHAGGLPIEKSVQGKFTKSPMPADLLDALDSGSGQILVASSRDQEVSYTGDPYSVFTACLIEALEGTSSVTQDGYARILEVLSYLFKNVPSRTSDKQHPFVNRISALSDNFPLCYYAKDSKDRIEDDPDQIESVAKPGERPTTGQLSRARKQLEGFQSEWGTRRKKLDYLRSAHAVESSAASRFQLEQQLLAEETAISDLEAKMEALERLIENP